MCGAIRTGMGMVFVLAIVLALVGVIALFTHALRADPSEEGHRWLVVVPLLIIVGWLLEELIMG